MFLLIPDFGHKLLDILEVWTVLRIIREVNVGLAKISTCVNIDGRICETIVDSQCQIWGLLPRCVFFSER